jgi:hypothetical protein
MVHELQQFRTLVVYIHPVPHILHIINPKMVFNNIGGVVCDLEKQIIKIDLRLIPLPFGDAHFAASLLCNFPRPQGARNA